jgi:hypothetical protein
MLAWVSPTKGDFLENKFKEFIMYIYNIFKVFIMYFEVQILVIWNNHDFGVLMDGSVKCVENQCKNSECMHVKCKSLVTVMWNNSTGIKFHFY